MGLLCLHSDRSFGAGVEDSCQSLRFDQEVLVQKGEVMRSLIRDQRGVSGVEYAVIGSLIAVAAMTAWQATGTKSNDLFCGVAKDLSQGGQDPCNKPKTRKQLCADQGSIWNNDFGYCYGGPTGLPPWERATNAQKDQGKRNPRAG